MVMAVLTSDHAADKSLWSWGISEAQTPRLWVTIGFWIPAFLILRSRLPKGSDCCLETGGGSGAESSPDDSYPLAFRKQPQSDKL